MARFFYNLFWPLGLLLFLPASMRKMIRRGGYRKDFGQRLGLYSRVARENLRPRPTWIHAVSVGEIMIALKIAAALRERDPSLNCILTTTTTTGHALAEKSAPEWIEVFYSPLDFWPVMRRAFRFFAPDRIVLVEAEVWPNMVARARATGVPVMLANARLSPRSEKRFRRFRKLVAPIFRQLDLIAVPDQIDAARWRALGGRNIVVAGNVKYDLRGPKPPLPPELSSEFAASTVLLGASTHAGEEEILGRVFKELRTDFPSLRLVIVPRHVERAPNVIRQLRSLGLTVQRRTETLGGDCLLVDTTGELRAWLEIATVVFVGKSLTAHGGQNPVEAVAAGKPVLFGPKMENFAQISAQLVRDGGAIIVRNEEELRETSRRLLQSSAAREQMTSPAREVIAPHQGAAARTAAAIEEHSTAALRR